MYTITTCTIPRVHYTDSVYIVSTIRIRCTLCPLYGFGVHCVHYTDSVYIVSTIRIRCTLCPLYGFGVHCVHYTDSVYIVSTIRIRCTLCPLYGFRIQHAHTHTHTHTVFTRHRSLRTSKHTQDATHVHIQV